MWMHGPFVGGFFFIFPVMLLILFVIFRVLRGGRRGFHGGCGGMRGRPLQRPPASDARELLDQCYVRGEIDHEQYLKMKQALE